jgi:hypothetical protein
VEIKEIIQAGGGQPFNAEALAFSGAALFGF